MSDDLPREVIPSWTHKEPPFNHTRNDGPYDPCRECLGLMSREQLIELVRSLKRDSSDNEHIEPTYLDIGNKLRQAANMLSQTRNLLLKKHRTRKSHITQDDILALAHAEHGVGLILQVIETYEYASEGFSED